MESIHNHANLNVSKYLLGNKCDKSDSRVISYEEGNEMAQKYNMKFFETSAKDGINLREVIEGISKDVLSSKNIIQKGTEITAKLENPKVNKKCC